jgi:hypothetical protein
MVTGETLKSGAPKTCETCGVTVLRLAKPVVSLWNYRYASQQRDSILVRGVTVDHIPGKQAITKPENRQS